MRAMTADRFFLSQISMVGAYLLAKIVLEDEICRGMRQFLALKRGAVSRLILIFAGINLNATVS